MDYLELLKNSAIEAGNIVCMGLDPQLSPMSEHNDFEVMRGYLLSLLEAMKKASIKVAAFKPNIGYYVVFDRPFERRHEGSDLLSEVITLIRELFKGTPIILDSKRGDIQRSSQNYAEEAFEVWKADAVTVSPYMGSDSVSPFFEDNKGVYILDRTSNAGAKDFQSRSIIDRIDEREVHSLFTTVAHHIASWAKEHPGVGAVVGATGSDELFSLASYFAEKSVPLLIPGVGSQGGSATETIRLLRKAGYRVEFARINSSSGLTHPWKKGPRPKDAQDLALAEIKRLIKEAAL